MRVDGRVTEVVTHITNKTVDRCQENGGIHCVDCACSESQCLGCLLLVVSEKRRTR